RRFGLSVLRRLKHDLLISRPTRTGVRASDCAGRIEGRLRAALAVLRASADPLLAALVELLLPERHALLERVDHVFARGEGVLAVRRRDGDRHTRFADLYSPEALP